MLLNAICVLVLVLGFLGCIFSLQFLSLLNQSVVSWESLSNKDRLR